MAFPECVEALAAAARKPENRGYADNGADPYKQAAARWMMNVCGVEYSDTERKMPESHHMSWSSR